MSSLISSNRRVIALAAAAVMFSLLAASSTYRYTRDIESRVGSLMPVVVAARDLPRGTRMTQGANQQWLSVKRVPRRFVPGASFAQPGELAGRVAAVEIPAGSYLNAGQFVGSVAGESGAIEPSRPGERMIQIAAEGVDAKLGVRPGARVDVVVTGGSSEAKATLMLAGIEVLEIGGDAPASERPDAARRFVKLRADARSAVALTAANQFARSLLLLARAPSERSRLTGYSISALREFGGQP